jgi:translocation and assembly module TamA
MVVEGNEGVSDRQLLERLALEAEDGYAWSDEQFLDPVLFERDAPRIARVYRAFGYYHARLDAISLRWTPEGSGLVLTFHVTEGAPTILETLTLTGLDDLPSAALRDVRPAIRVEEGEVITEDDWDATKSGIRRALRNNGFPVPLVTGTVVVDDVADTATAELIVDAGPRARFGAAEISGLEGVPEESVRTELGITPGDWYSAEEIDNARTALIAIGVFSSVEISEVPLGSLAPPAAAEGGEDGVVGLDVQLEEGDMQRLKLGVGVGTEQGRQQAEVTATYEHRNLFGGLRRLQWTNRFGWAFDLGGIGVPDRRVDLGPFGLTSLTFRQPHLGDLQLAFVSSLKYEAVPTANDYSTQAIQARVGAERTFRDRTLSLGLYNSVRWVDLWNVVNQSNVVDVPYVLYLLDFAATLDLRDDPLEARDGHFVSLLLRLGMDPRGGEYDADPARDYYRYFLLKADLRGYYALHERVTLALRVSAGFILPIGAEAMSPPDERFFSGGANSVRGLPYRAIGSWCVEDSAATSPTCSLSPAGGVPAPGGETLWEASLELRVEIIGGLSAAAFFDAGSVLDGFFSSVYSGVGGLVHPTVGGGLRYRTPIGPIRFDVGVPLQTDPRLGSMPAVAFQLTLGEAF